LTFDKKMKAQDLAAAISQKKSYLCVGLDTEPTKLPVHLGMGSQAILTFNQAIFEATEPYAVSYKINVAFYEAMGVEGWRLLEATRKMAPANCYLIADAKRGDIGNTAGRYAEAFFGQFGFDALTVNPYMGLDTLTPYLEYPNGDIFILACTSNPGFADFENQTLANGRKLYEEVVIKCQELPHQERVHYVVGATRPQALAEVRALTPASVLLVPGVGAQGGSLAEATQAAYTTQAPLLINASRSILYAGGGQDFAHKAGSSAAELAAEMSVMLESLSK
jgi:orotidine-5'-phosphate decarboxylase